MSDKDDVLDDVDLDNFNFDDLSFEKGDEVSGDEKVEGNGEDQDPITTAFMDTNGENVEEVSASDETFVSEDAPIESAKEDTQFEEAFAEGEATIESGAEESQFEEAFAGEEMQEESVAEEPSFEEAFVSEKMPAGQGEPMNGVEFSENAGYLRWYSGASDEDMFEVNKNFMSGRFEADAQKKIIHVNAGYDTYGWSVQFFDGVTMNLRDVKEYQIRNGKLPCPDGRIIYGKQSVEFSGIERIVVYESVKYFSYGV